MKPLACGAVIAALALTGCGVGSKKSGPDSNDKRGNALACLHNKYKLVATRQGADFVQVGDPKTGPRIRFFLTRGQAEAEQFEGRAEGTLQSGSALIYVRKNGDKLLGKVEDCVDSL